MTHWVDVPTSVRRGRMVAAAGFLFASMGAAADAQINAPLALREAVQVALDRQPLLDALDAQARAARDTAVSAAQLPDPRLVGGIQDLPIDGRDAYSLGNDSDTQVVVGVSQEFPRAAKRKLRGELRNQQATRLDEERALASRAVRRDVSNAWIDVWREERARTIAQATLADSELQQKAVAIAVSAARATQAELATARVGTERLRDAVASREQAIERARAGLSRWIGDAAERPTPEDEPDITVAANPDAVAEGLRANPELSVLQARIDEADVDARLAQAASLPDWRLEVGYGNRSEHSDMMVLKVGVDLPLFTHNRQGRDLASAYAMRDAAQADREDATRRLTADLRSARRELGALAQRARNYADVIVPESEQAVDAALAAWRANNGTLIQVIDARRVRFDTRLAELDLIAEAARRKVDLAYLAGPELADPKVQP